MNWPVVSVLVPTYRPGGLDLLKSSLDKQVRSAIPFELVLVDCLYEKRKRIVRDYFASAEYAVAHVPPIERADDEYRFPFYCGARHFNTGFLAARGKIILIACDYLIAGTRWIEKMTEGLGPNEARIGECTYVMPPPGFRWPSGVDADLLPSLFREPEVWSKPGHPLSTVGTFPGLKGGDPIPQALAYVSKNMSLWRERALEVGGMEELYDGGGGQTDIEMGLRLTLTGIAFKFARAPVSVVRMHEIVPRPMIGRTDAEMWKIYRDRWDSETAFFSPYPAKSIIKTPKPLMPVAPLAVMPEKLLVWTRTPKWMRWFPRWRARTAATSLRASFGALDPKTLQLQFGDDGRAWDLDENWRPVAAPIAKRPDFGWRWCPPTNRVERVHEGEPLNRSAADVIVFLKSEGAKGPLADPRHDVDLLTLPMDTVLIDDEGNTAIRRQAIPVPLMDLKIMRYTGTES